MVMRNPSQDQLSRYTTALEAVAYRQHAGEGNAVMTQKPVLQCRHHMHQQYQLLMKSTQLDLQTVNDHSAFILIAGKLDFNNIHSRVVQSRARRGCCMLE